MDAKYIRASLIVCLLTCMLLLTPQASGVSGAEAALAPPGMKTIAGEITSADWNTGKLKVAGYTVYVRENSVLRSRAGGKEKRLTPLDFRLGDVVSVLAVPEGDHFVARILELKPRQ